ncbi:hypothetical protein BDV59DRAFT_145075 [Aspergillus ambiguus]|uniref:uncharacterized protein n=1 Tax=Aspergillus ambiguus TaxID=176160 RepID=UPI003CCE2092
MSVQVISALSSTIQAGGPCHIWNELCTKRSSKQCCRLINIATRFISTSASNRNGIGKHVTPQIISGIIVPIKVRQYQGQCSAVD